MWNPNISFRRNCDNTYGTPWFQKRKIDPESGEYDLPPPKMLITEEKMVSQLKGIHLSQDYTSHGNPGTSNSEVDMEDPLSAFNQKTSTLPTLHMCEEIKELNKVVDSPLPKQLLDDLKRPTNALVLWRPPAGELGKYLMTIRDSNTSNSSKAPQQNPVDVNMEEDDDNNNESANQNMNGIFARTI